MMEWKCKTYGELTADELYAALRLRSEVFVVEQGCAYLDLDGKDSRCWHLMGCDGGHLVAYLRVIPLGVESQTEGSIGRIVVAADHRGTGLGHELVERGITLYDRLVGSDHPIAIHAQSRLEAFYAGHGFKATSEPFMFEGMLHTMMERKGKKIR